MRKLISKIIQLLDGTPAIYGQRQTGQSVVELALITPILIILLAGLVEIGWFANNYLSLLDVTRAGARRAAVLQDQKSPLFWDNIYSTVPNVLLPPLYQRTNGVITLLPNADPAKVIKEDEGLDIDRFHNRWMTTASLTTYPTATTGNAGEFPCSNTPGFERFFYNEVICTMITTMDPLRLNQSNGIDDIIISGFALQRVDATAHMGDNWLAGSYDATKPQIVVAGRYPTNANECDVRQDAAGNPVISSRDGRDPFDINNDQHRWIASPDTPNADIPYETAGPFTEIAGYDADPAFTTLVEADAEKQEGFSLYGNHKIPGTYCVGSEWTISQVESLMNLSNFDLDDNTKRDYLPSQGLVLAEIYWQHEMLLKIPILSPVYTAVGNKDGKMVINVWAAFPLGSVEPHIIFPD